MTDRSLKLIIIIVNLKTGLHSTCPWFHWWVQYPGLFCPVLLSILLQLFVASSDQQSLINKTLLKDEVPEPLTLFSYSSNNIQSRLTLLTLLTTKWTTKLMHAISTAYSQHIHQVQKWNQIKQSRKEIFEDQ